jgi:Domain of unknown function (DUF4280)
MTMAKLAVVQGAILKCDKGATPSLLSVTTHSSIRIEGKSVATIMDYLSGANIKPFSICAVTGNACAPVTLMPWSPGEPSIPLVPSIFPILSNVSVLPCAVGGIIQILSAGQTTVSIDSQTTRSINQEQNKKRRDVHPPAQPDEKDDADDNPSLQEELKKIDGMELDIPIPEIGQDLMPQSRHHDSIQPQAKPWTKEDEEASEEMERRIRILFPNSDYAKSKEAEDREYKKDAEDALDAAKKVLTDVIKIGTERRIKEAKEEVRIAEENLRRVAQGRQPLRGRPRPKTGK